VSGLRPGFWVGPQHSGLSTVFRGRRCGMHAIQSFLVVVLCGFVWLTIILGLALAEEITIYDRDWRVKGHIEDGKVYDENRNLRYRVEDGRIYDRDWKTKGRIEKGRVYDENWKLKYRIEGDRVYVTYFEKNLFSGVYPPSITMEFLSYS
jgi:hypothetical protein